MTYREQFKPSATRDKPLAILALHVVCADTDADAERLATSVDLNFALRRQGRYQPIPSPEEAAAHSYSPTDRALIGQNRARLVVGSKTTVMAHLEPLIKATQADEVMVTTMIYDHEARKHSYALLAEAFGLTPGTRRQAGSGLLVRSTADRGRPCADQSPPPSRDGGDRSPRAAEPRAERLSQPRGQDRQSLRRRQRARHSGARALDRPVEPARAAVHRREQGRRQRRGRHRLGGARGSGRLHAVVRAGAGAVGAAAGARRRCRLQARLARSGLPDLRQHDGAGGAAGFADQDHRRPGRGGQAEARRS